jgi:hypothetical protein
MGPDEVARALPVIRERCEEIGRDPATLAVSDHIWTEHSAAAGAPRVERLAALRELGLSRVMTIVRASAESDEALESFAEDVRASGAELAA